MSLICCLKKRSKVGVDPEFAKNRSSVYSPDFTSKVIDLRTLSDKGSAKSGKASEQRTEILALNPSSPEIKNDLRLSTNILFENTFNADVSRSTTHRHTIARFGVWDNVRNFLRDSRFEFRKKHKSTSDADLYYSSSEASRNEFKNDSTRVMSPQIVKESNLQEETFYRQRLYSHSPPNNPVGIPEINVIFNDRFSTRIDDYDIARDLDSNTLLSDERLRKPSSTSESDYADLDYDEVTTSLEREERLRSERARVGLFAKFNEAVAFDKSQRRPLPEINEPLEVSMDNCIYCDL